MKRKTRITPAPSTGLKARRTEAWQRLASWRRDSSAAVTGGVLGVLSTALGSYYGPRRLEEWRAARADQPKKNLLRTLLDDPRFPDGRHLETLRIVTGTSEEECRRLLIEVEAR